ncbi:hypothetical protein NQ317_007546 [Molorchus minor]|uniref:Partial AB-hydrolase lipase domain-containing protein n=1 Tax=Molorchus minor TaxID=1323400 RepID=A0ABQ9K6B6_9CUCU|nr:hypothetical protein NQ317_007546 [Molorchus minor]
MPHYMHARKGGACFKLTIVRRTTQIKDIDNSMRYNYNHLKVKMKALLVLAFLNVGFASTYPRHLPSDQLKALGLDNLAAKISKAANQTMEDMVRSKGYDIESHYVTTTDGYILNIFRIPNGKNGESNGKIVFLQHGLLVSSIDWVTTEKSLAYMLADEGYDVWLGNSRGNTFGRNHTTLDPEVDKAAFWSFSWHEIGNIDVPTMIDYILEETGSEQIHYVGHSQGTTSFYVMASTKPDYNDKIISSVSLAPIGFMENMTSPILRILANWQGPLGGLMELLGLYELLPGDDFISTIATGICSDEGAGAILCENFIFLLCGFNNNQMNLTLLPTIMAQVPAGCATRQLVHYGQEIQSGRFCQYDYGYLENLNKYGALTPPDYNLALITSPVHMIYSVNDWMAGLKDVDRLCEGLGNCVDKYEVEDKTFNHIDFIYGMGAPTLVYKEVVKILAKY